MVLELFSQINLNLVTNTRNLIRISSVQDASCSRIEELNSADRRNEAVTFPKFHEYFQHQYGSEEVKEKYVMNSKTFRI